MVHLRSLRASDRDELPRHYEENRLRPGVRTAGWVLALVLVAWGVAAMVRQAGAWFEAAGAAAAAVGGMLLVALVRFRSHEVVVGDRWIRMGTGPLVHRVGRLDVRVGELRPARSWRRLYAPTEVEVEVPGWGVVLVVPSRDARGLGEAVREAGAGENAGRGGGVVLT